MSGVVKDSGDCTSKLMQYIAVPGNRDEFKKFVWALQGRNIWLRWLKGCWWEDHCESDGERAEDLRQGKDEVTDGKALEPWLNKEVTVLREVGLGKYVERFEDGAELLSQMEDGGLKRDLAIFEAQEATWADVGGAGLLAVNRRFVKAMFKAGSKVEHEGDIGEFKLSDGDYWKWFIKPGSKNKKRKITVKAAVEAESGKRWQLARFKVPLCGYFALQNLGTFWWTNGKKLKDQGLLEINGSGVVLRLSLTEAYRGVLRKKPHGNKPSGANGTAGSTSQFGGVSNEEAMKMAKQIGTGGSNEVPVAINDARTQTEVFRQGKSSGGVNKGGDDRFEQNSEKYHYPPRSWLFDDGSPVHSVESNPEMIVGALWEKYSVLINWHVDVVDESEGEELKVEEVSQEIVKDES